MRTITATSVLILTAAVATAAYAAANRVSIETSNGQRCITSNGIPDHETGTFPAKGNPNTISTQSIEFCVTTNPVKGSSAQRVNTVGIAKNGIIVRPGTADWYDASSPRGHSRDRSSGWNLEGVGSGQLGVDHQHAHVDNRGIYHYHAMPDALVGTGSDTLFGYAADGFEIHYIGSSAVSSWQLKSGTRPTAPGGKYDGTYNQDFEYVANSGNLDECNGAMVNGTYTYFATDAYPFFPRCLYGTDITQFGGPGGGGEQGRPANGQRGNKPPRKGILGSLFGGGN